MSGGTRLRQRPALLRTCEECGSTYQAYRPQLQRYCSRRCRNRWHQRRYYAAKHDPTYVPPQCLELHEGQEALSDADQYVLGGGISITWIWPPVRCQCCQDVTCHACTDWDVGHDVEEHL